MVTLRGAFCDNLELEKYVVQHCCEPEKPDGIETSTQARVHIVFVFAWLTVCQGEKSSEICPVVQG